MDSKNKPDTSAADEQSAELEKQFDENQKKEGEQRDELDKEEMALLKSNGNLQYVDEPLSTRLITGMGSPSSPSSSSNSQTLTNVVSSFATASGEEV